MLEERSLTSGVISLLDEDGTAVSHEAGVTHNYLFIVFFCPVPGDKQAPVFHQGLGRMLNSH